MKQIYKYFLVLILSSSLFISCDLNTTPTTSLDAGIVFDRADDADKILIGSWAYLMETFNTYRNPGYASFLQTSDVMGSDVTANGKYGPTRDNYPFTGIYSKNTTNALSWTLAYATINNMNGIIKNIDNASGSTDDKNRIKGQAYALRGFIYLHLASFYSFAIDKDPNAVCVPIYTEPSDASTVGKPAASVSEVYAQAVSDLEEALSLIPANYVRSSKYKVDTQVVLGLLSRANLYSRNWTKAKEYSDQLLARNNYLMTESEYKSGFNSVDNKEWIWGHPQTPDQSNASYAFNYWDTTTNGSGYFSFNLDPYFRDLFDDGDYRKSMMYWDVNPGSSQATTTDVWMRYAKFKFREDFTGDIVLMRTSEIYLINAEAKARLNDPDAVIRLNDLKRARNAQTVSLDLSGQPLLDAIWLERRKELWGEGFSLVDIIRNQQKVVRKQYNELTPINYTYTDSEGVTHTVPKYPKGHSIFKFPDGSDFAPNSKYYLYRITDSEETENPNLYSLHPKLDLYK